jgi:U1 small nuclear ribonucleoprotein A
MDVDLVPPALGNGNGFNSESVQKAVVAPQNTVYVNNLNEKTKVEDLKRALYFHFCSFGSILELNAAKTHRLRGQAWVVFEKLSSAVKAVRDMDGFDFLGKPMKCQFARSKSDVIAKADGTFVQRSKRVAKEDEKGPNKKKRSHTPSARAEGGAGEAAAGERDAAAQGEAGPGDASLNSMQVDAKQVDLNINAPNPILFVENLPESCDQNMLGTLFGQFPGLVETNIVPGDNVVAFVEFRDIPSASAALDGLNKHQLGDSTLKITYTKS